MYCKGLFKRAIPFLLTFVIGVLIASIFVPFTGSGFQFRRNWREKHRQYHEKQETEIQQLREENERLRQKLLKEGDDPVVMESSSDVTVPVKEVKRVDVIKKVEKSVKVSAR